MKVAFLGLGTMGAPMASNVLKRGHALTVWNRTRARAQSLVDAGAHFAASPAEAAASAEVVITMLADPAAVEAVIAGPEGVLDGLRAGTTVVEMSTIDPATVRSLAERVCARRGDLLDAPVSGSRRPAETGDLVIFVGGEAEPYERLRPLLEAMGRPRRVGALGQGAALKLVLNGLGAHMIAGFCATLVLGVKQGLEPRQLLDAIQAGAFSSPLYAAKGERLLAGDFAPDFSLELMLKDQRLVLAAASALGYVMPTERAIAGVLEQAVAAGLGGLDLCGLIRLFESWAGVEVRS
jgi:3-hydroxyisobutyrate dehydrogenase